MRARLISLSLIILFVLGSNIDPGYGSARLPAPGSFDSGSTADLAIGAPYEVFGVFPDDMDDAGAIHVLFGERPDGLSGTSDLYWDQNTPGITGAPEEDDKFGKALAIGNFNCDEFDDLAVGVPLQSVMDNLYIDQPYAGIVHVFYGDSGGLSTDGDQVWSQGVGNIGSNPESGDHFGDTLAAADFNGDGCDDLAVGAPGEDGDQEQSGIVQIIYGSDSGLTDAGTSLFRQGDNGLQDSEEEFDQFGSALATGDFDGDSFSDLAIGVPDEDFGEDGVLFQGVAHIIYGSLDGLTTSGNQLFHQDLPEMNEEAEHEDEFGRALVSGNFNGDPYDDLAIGVKGEGDGVDLYHGAVHVLFGWSAGLSDLGSLYIDKGGLGLDNDISAYFGRALASSDINGDGFDDLAIGASNDEYSAVKCGNVYVLYGDSSFGSPYSYERVIQGVNDILDSCEAGDNFGRTLAMGDYNGDLFGDLAVGVPFEDPGDPEVNNAGAVNVIYGAGSGLTGDDNQFWYQGYNGVEGVAEVGDRFGSSLAARPFSVEFLYLPMVVK